MYERLRDVIDELCKECGWTYQRIAEQAGMTEEDFCYKLEGNAEFEPEQIDALARLIGATPEGIDNLFFCW